jgi:hypothetical protein
MHSIPLLLAGDEVVVIAMVGGLILGIIGMIGGFFRAATRERTRGQTQREIAAYVAEGSITAEEGERLMRAANEPTQTDKG